MISIDRSPPTSETSGGSGSCSHAMPLGARLENVGVRAGSVESSECVTSFDTLYATHFNSLALQLYAYTGDLFQAQDLVQEAFCRALQRWKSLSTYDDPVAWVRRVAWNLAASRWRQLRRHAAFLGRQRERHAPEPSPDHVALTTALATLPANQRRAMVMHYLADMSIAEIAQHSGVAAGTVKSWLHRGRTALAAALTDQGEAAGRA